MTEQTEQWLLQGDCSKCRREKYCTKLCTRAARAEEAMFRGMVLGAFHQATGGVYAGLEESLAEVTLAEVTQTVSKTTKRR